MEHSRDTDIIDDFLRTLKRGTSLLKERGGLFNMCVVFGVATSELSNQRALVAVKKAMVQCAKNNHTEDCYQRIYDKIKPILDNYTLIAIEVEKLPIPSIVKNRVLINLAKWDALIEECSVGRDPEINKMFSDIGRHLEIDLPF